MEKSGSRQSLKLLLFLTLVVLGIAFRTIWHLAPNVEFVTTASLLAARYLGILGAVSVPVLTMFATDLVIGNAKIYLFTWSAYIFIGLGGLVLKRWKSPFKLILASSLLSLTSGVFFYLYTNFGVWLLDEWGMYPKTISGLVRCYYMGLPFLKLNLLGNLLFTPISFAVFSFLPRFSSKDFWRVFSGKQTLVVLERGKTP